MSRLSVHSPTPYEVDFFLLPGFSMMSLSAAIEPLRCVNGLCGEPLYRWRLRAREVGSVAANNELCFQAELGIEHGDKADMTVVVSSDNTTSYEDPPVMEWLRRRQGFGRRVVAISNGALILARAGLLNGRRATIHWEEQETLAQRYPTTTVVPDLYCIDDDIWSAAGGEAAMDLMLCLIAERQGASIAEAVAEQFLHGIQRAPESEQRHAISWRYGAYDARVAQAIHLIEQSLATPPSLSDMAAAVNLSPRQLTRLFKAQLGKSPTALCTELRLARVQKLLRQSNLPLERIAHECGFSCDTHLIQIYKQHFGNTPGRYRQESQQDCPYN